MTLLSFGTSQILSIPQVVLLSGTSILLLSLLSVLLYFALSLAQPRSSVRQAVGGLLTTLFVFFIYRPFYPGGGLWPPRLDPEGALLSCIQAAALGAVLVYAVGAGTRALRRAAKGFFLGGAAGLAGIYANRLLFIADALRDIGYPGWGTCMLWSMPLGYGALLILWAALASMERPVPVVRLLCALVLLSGAVAAGEYGEGYMRSAWDFGKLSLVEASGITPAGEARTIGVAVLADAQGRPGRQYREYLLAASGVDASPESLDRIESYLADQAYHTVHLAQALEALRLGRSLNWDASGYLDAAMIRVDPGFPPDTAGFLAAMSVAPTTSENYGRLETMGSYSWFDKIPHIKTAQNTFEGFSTAYARFGELENANLWLDRIRGLWPLYEDPIHIEPVASLRDGQLRGSILFKHAAAGSLRVGLFALPSTMTVVDASGYLVDSTHPDAEGRFGFNHLLPGYYYLAIQGDPHVIDDGGLFWRDTPGKIVLKEKSMRKDLPPIVISHKLETSIPSLNPRPIEVIDRHRPSLR